MARLKLINPATGRVIESVPTDDPKSVAKKVHAARDAQPEWAARPLRERIAVLHRFRDRIVATTEELARILTTETGKPISQARNEL